VIYPLFPITLICYICSLSSKEA